MAELPNLELYAAELKFGWATERRVEGGHAHIARRVSSARCQSEAVDSLTLRMNQRERHMTMGLDAVQKRIDSLTDGRALRVQSARALHAP